MKGARKNWKKTGNSSSLPFSAHFLSRHGRCWAKPIQLKKETPSLLSLTDNSSLADYFCTFVHSKDMEADDLLPRELQQLAKLRAFWSSSFCWCAFSPCETVRETSKKPTEPLETSNQIYPGSHLNLLDFLFPKNITELRIARLFCSTPETAEVHRPTESTNEGSVEMPAGFAL